MTVNRALVALATRLIRVLVAAWPARLRSVYGPEMKKTFADGCADAAARGTPALAIHIVRDLADFTIATVRARRVRNPRTASSAERLTVATILTDIRFAFRMLRREPMFTAVAIVTLALGIGATTAIFTVVNGVLLRPLPYRDPDRLLQLLNGRPSSGGTAPGRLSMAFSPPNFRDVTTESGVFESVTAMTPMSSNVTELGDPQQLDGASVTTSFFATLGVAPRFGRGFVDADAQIGAAPVVILSDALWRRLFGGRTDVVGSTIRLDGQPVSIVGIAPPDLRFPSGAEFWRPLIFSAHQLSDGQRGAQWVNVVARLKSDVSFDQAKAAMTLVADRLARDYPRTNKDRAMTAIRLHDRVVRGVRPALLVLLGAVALVLLVACVNVANLLLARANGRAREVAVRAAVGAGRGRLVQQFLVESVVLGVTGGLAGLAVAFWSTRALVALGPTQIPRLAEVGVDGRVLAFTIATAVVTGVVFGLVPALASTGGAIGRIISAAGRGSIGAAGSRLRKTLVVAEMALAVMLLVGAGLLVRSYQRISDVNPGFAPDHVLTFNLAFPDAKYKTSAAIARFVDDYVARLRTRPGVENASAVYGIPLDTNFGASSSFRKPGEADSGDSPSVGMRIVTPDYFSTMKIPIRAGRAFDAHDTDTSPEVVIINEEAARRYWPDENPIGQQMYLAVRLASDVRSGQKTIVGVVGNVKYGGLDATAPPEAYLPHQQHPVDAITIAVRTTGDPTALVPTARAELASLDRELPMAAIRTMDEIVGQSIAERRFLMLLLAAFAAVAVSLAAVGVYGVLAFVVSQRTQEIGLRLAIGASPEDVVRLFLREGIVLASAGVLIGLLGAAAAGRALTTLLFGVTSRDPVTFAAVAAALGAAALCASYLPARRAARVDPMDALRTD